MRRLIALLCLLPAGLFAQPTDPWIDLVWLTTGDRVSGEILQLTGSKLTVKTPFAGSIKIDWTMVERIESKRNFAIELGSGLQIEGTIERAEDEVRIVAAGDEQVVTPAEIKHVERTSENKTFWDVADLNIGLGASLTGGNSDLRQSSTEIAFRHRTTKRKVTADLRSIMSREDKDGRIRRNEGNVRVDRFLTKDVFAYGLGAYESDEKSLLDLRLTGGGGIGWQLRRTSNLELSLRGGLNVIREHFRADETNPAKRGTSAESMIGFEAQKETAREIELFFKSYLHPSIQQHRYRLNGDAGVRVPVFKFLIWSLSGFSRFDSDPPTDKKRNDYGLVTSFGFQF